MEKKEPFPIHTMERLPPLLAEITDPPEKLFIRGIFPDTKLSFLAVVGARMYTPYGKYVCETLIRELQGYPIVIVSGLALGIDGIAHTSALEAGLPTVAVPGSGLDDSALYPATHRTLAKKIMEEGGALVSEFNPLWKPRPESFPQRNRIMAGMCHAVLVVEAEARSGTLITARLASEYNRDVLAVPGPLQHTTSKGPHLLLKNGACLVETGEDIARALNIEKPKTGQPPLPLSLSPDERNLTALLPLSRDTLLSKLCAQGKTISEIHVLIVSLELRGIIKEQMGEITLA